MAQPKRGEVWLVDLGLAAKVRPWNRDDDFVAVAVDFHVGALTGSRR